MKAVILAAGVARRLRPLTDNTPKCLLEAGGKAILGHMADQLIRNNITEWVLVTGYLHEMIENYLKNNYPQLKVSYIHNPVFETTNNIYSLWLAAPEIRGKNFILLDSDIVFDYRIIERLRTSGKGNCLAMNSHYKLGEEEIKVTCNADGLIRSISKITDPKTAAGESIGIEIFDEEGSELLFREIAPLMETHEGQNLFYERAFENAIDKGLLMYALDTSDLPSMEIDFVEDFEKAAQEIIPKICT